MSKIVVTIDGPAASGKSSVSRGVANARGWNWLSTGSFYRGLAYAALKEGLDLTDRSALVALSGNREVWSVEMTPQKTEVLYRGVKVTDDVQKEEVGNIASQISPFPEVREALLTAQRSCAELGPLVAEGRDCGTVVFPRAPVKVYLTARSDARAARRALEQGKSVEETAQAQKIRDKQDTERKTAPLQMAENSELIDTSELDLEQVIARVQKIIDDLIEQAPELAT